MARSSRNKSASSNKESRSAKPSPAADSPQSNEMDIIVAFLLLTGVLRVEQVQFYRSSRMGVTLSGDYGRFRSNEGDDKEEGN